MTNRGRYAAIALTVPVGWQRSCLPAAAPVNRAAGGAVSSSHSQALALVTLVCWVITISLGAFMLRALIVRGILRRQRASEDRLPPVLLAGHFSLALTGLAVWASYLAAGWIWLAWLAVGLLMPVIGLGISTVTLWTPYPGPLADYPGPLAEPGADEISGADAGAAARTDPAADTLASRLSAEDLADALDDEALACHLVDDMVTRLLSDPPAAAPRPRSPLAALIPAGHGIAAGTTFLLAVLTAAGSRVA